MRGIVRRFEAFSETRKAYRKSIFKVSSRLALRVKKIMKFSGKQVAAARELLGLTQSELASAAGVHWLTLSSFESGKSAPRPSSLQKIEAELDRRGIEFTNGTGIGVRLNFEKAAVFARTAAQERNASDGSQRS